MYGFGVLFERQADIEPDGLAARFIRAAVGRLHDAGSTAGGDDKAMVFGRERATPRGEGAGELARLLVVARPLDGLAGLLQFDLETVVGGADTAGPQRLERPLGALAAVDARRSEEDDRVLNLLVPEPPQRLEVLGENSNRPCFVALEKLRVQIRQRL